MSTSVNFNLEQLPLDVLDGDEYIRHPIDNTVGRPLPEKPIELQFQILKPSNNLVESHCTSMQSRTYHIKDVASPSCSKGMENLVEQTKNYLDNGAEFMKTALKLGSDSHQKCQVYDSEANTRDRLNQKRPCDRLSVDSSEGGSSLEQNIRASLVSEIEVLKNSLTIETQNVLSLTAQLQSLEKDKQDLLINLQRAEEEVRVISEENDHLLKLYDYAGNDGKIKSKKRKIN